MTVQSEAPLQPGDPGFGVPGAPTTSTGEDSVTYEDYFGFEERHQWFFPDNKQFIEFKKMNEGERARFQKMTTRDVTVVRGTGDARVKMDAASERHSLIIASVTGWTIYRAGRPLPFSSGSPGANLEQWLAVAHPDHVDALEKAIRKVNPWLSEAMTVEDIDKEMDRLRELRDEVIERERGESSSASK